MNIVFIMPFWTGLRPLVLKKGRGFPIGMPAVYKLLKRLTKSGHKVNVIFPVRPIDKEYASIGVVTNLKIIGVGFYIIPLKYPKILKILEMRNYKSRIITPYRMLYFYRKLIPIMKRIKPNIIYAAVQEGLVASTLANRFKLPLILRAFGTFIGTSNDPGDLDNKLFQLKHLSTFLLFRRHYSYLIMTNDGTRGDTVSKAFGFPKEKLKFWINGVDKSAKCAISKEKIGYLRKELHLNCSQKIILTVSRLAYWKRVDRVVRCAPLIKSKIDNVQFIIIGDGPELMNLKMLAKKIGAESYVKFLGFKSHNEIYNYMQVADIFVSTYDVSNLCNPLLEAMACGKCIVSLNDGSLDQIIKNGRNGVLINSQKIEEEMPKVIIGLLGNDGLRIKLGRQARIFVENNLETWNERIDKEIKLLESLVRIN